jgi:hypothetical protein
MTGDEGNGKRRSAIKTAAVALVLMAAVGGGIALTSTTPTSPEIPVSSQSDVTIYLTYNADIQGDTLWPASDQVLLQGVTFRGQDATADLNHNGTTWTNVTQINIQSTGKLHVDPGNRGGLGASETTDSLKIKDVDPTTEDGTEVIYTSSGATTLYLNNTGLSEGQGVVAVDPQDGSPLDAASVEANGDVVFDELPSGTEEVDFRKGPAELTVYRETQPATKVTSTAGLTFRFYSGTESETVTEKTVTDGTVDLTGIPSTARVVITVDDGDSNYYYRRITLESLTQQRDIYLLNNTLTTNPSTVKFRLDDQTGQFDPSSTVVRVRKPIRKDFDGDGTDETRYKTVTGGNFGSANSFRANLISDTRYRLVVTNANGNTRVLGTYTPDGDDTEVLPIGSIKINAGNDGANYYSQAEVENTTSGPVIRFKYADPAKKTESLSYEIYNVSGGSDTLIATGSPTGPFGTFQATHTIGTTDAEYRVDVSGERGTDTISQTAHAGEIPAILKRIPLDAKWMNLLGYLGIVAFAGFGVIIDSRLGGATAVVFAVIFTALGVVEIPFALLSAAAGVTVMFLASTEGAGQP